MQWAELERLLEREGAAPPPARSPPRAYALPSMNVTGDLEDGRADLQITVEVQVLADRWTVAPLLPEWLAVRSADVTAPDGRRGLLVRERGGVAFVAEGAGHYEVAIEAEGAPPGGDLLIAPPGLAGGRARLRVHGAERVAGRTAWRVSTASSGALEADAALGAAGLELKLDAPERTDEAGAALDDLEAVTVLSLGGTGVTRLTVNATADESGELIVQLPPGAHLWKAYVGGAALAPASVARKNEVHLPLKRAARVELAYTFDAPPIGIRGRYHVELPRLPVPVRDARWELWLPEGFAYGAAQAALAPASCGGGKARARTPITPQGRCFGYARAVLEPGRPYIEGIYDQPL